MLADFAVLKPIDVDLEPGDALAGRRLTHHRSLVCRDRGTALDNPVFGSDQILLGYDHIRERAVHHDPDLPQTLETRGQRRAEMVHEVLGVEEMANAIYVVFVLKYFCEFPYNLLVVFFLHRILLVMVDK